MHVGLGQVPQTPKATGLSCTREKPSVRIALPWRVGLMPFPTSQSWPVTTVTIRPAAILLTYFGAQILITDVTQ